MPQLTTIEAWDELTIETFATLEAEKHTAQLSVHP